MVLVKGIVMKYLLTLLLVIGMMAPAYAGPDFSNTKAIELEGQQLIHNIVQAPVLTKDQKIDILSQALTKAIYDVAHLEAYITWFVDGIARGVEAAPLKVIESIPPNMENADIPEFLVRQLMNIQAMKRTQDEVVGAPKAPPVLYLGIKLTGEEARRLTSSDDMINFVINHEDRVFFQVQK